MFPLPRFPLFRYVKCNRAVSKNALLYEAQQLAQQRQDCSAALLAAKGPDVAKAWAAKLNRPHDRIRQRGGMVVA